MNTRMEVASYNLDSYKDIAFSGFDYKLPSIILETIQKLSSELGVSNVSPTNNSKMADSVPFKTFSNTKRGGFGNKRNKLLEDEAWEKAKPFKTTQLEKKEGTEKLINDIRICLNKISNKNYDSQRDVILGHLKELIDIDSGEENNDSNRDELLKITKAIFDIASTNKFYSELYANLYKELMQECNAFKENILPFVEQYLENIKNIQNVDPKVNYDKYCDNNKENDKRKAMSAFIVNLTKTDIIGKSKTIDIILHLQNIVFQYIDEENKSSEIEEITENLFIFITTSHKILKDELNWETIIENIRNLAQLKTKDHKSMSSRALFKYMDILDYLKKNKD
jgi:hypothetical protein